MQCDVANFDVYWGAGAPISRLKHVLEGQINGIWSLLYWSSCTAQTCLWTTVGWPLDSFPHLVSRRRYHSYWTNRWETSRSRHVASQPIDEGSGSPPPPDLYKREKANSSWLLVVSKYCETCLVCYSVVQGTVRVLF